MSDTQLMTPFHAEFRFDTIEEAARKLAEVVSSYALLDILGEDFDAEPIWHVAQSIKVDEVLAKIALTQIMTEVAPSPTPEAAGQRRLWDASEER